MLRGIKTALGLCAVLWVVPALGATYYVDSAAGSDAGGAFNGLAPGNAFATIQTGLNAATNPGDTVYVLPGKGYGGGTGGADLAVLSNSGNSTNPITLSGYPGLPMPILTGTQSFQLVRVQAQWVVVNGLELAGWNGTLTLAGAWANASAASPNASGVYNGSGIGVGNDPNTVNTNAITAAGSPTLHFASQPAGVLIGDVVCDNSVIAAIPAGTTVTGLGANITMSANAAAPGVGSGNTIEFLHPYIHVTISNNRIHDFPKSGISAFERDYWTISGNVSYNNSLYSPLSGSGISLGFSAAFDTSTATKQFITSNVLHDNINLIANMFSGPNATTNGTTANGNSTLHFATSQIANGAAVGYQVYDVTAPAVIQPGTTITAFGGSGSAWTVTTSLPITGAGVGGTDSIRFRRITDGEGIIVDDNQGDQASQPAYTGRTLVQNNIGYGNGSSCIQPFASSHVDVIGNTCYLNQQTTFMAINATIGEINNESSKDSTFRNNILQTGAANKLFVDRQTGGGGDAFTNELGFGGDGTALPGSANVTGDPLFLAPSLVTPFLYGPPFNPYFNGFSLMPGSPAIDAGSSTIGRTTDFLGNTGLVGPAYDIGAFESRCSPYTTGVVTSTATLMATPLPVNSQAMLNLVASLWCGQKP